MDKELCLVNSSHIQLQSKKYQGGVRLFVPLSISQYSEPCSLGPGSLGLGGIFIILNSNLSNMSSIRK